MPEDGKILVRQAIIYAAAEMGLSHTDKDPIEFSQLLTYLRGRHAHMAFEMLLEVIIP